MANDLAERVAAVRRFNRFYTRQIGLLQERLLRTAFSLAEARAIYEIARMGSPTPTVLGRELDLDPGYLSRILGNLERRGLVDRRPSEGDGRSHLVSLTAAGRAAFDELDAASATEIEEVLRRLSEEEQRQLVGWMTGIERFLRVGPSAALPYLLRPPGSGDMGWVVQRHGVLYRQEYGWNETFEALVAEIVADFIRHFNPKRDRCWIAERYGENVGSVFLGRHPARDGVARLRLLLVEPRARGLGIGRRLVRECSRFARQAGYHTITLWTNDVLHAARRIYEGEGYALVDEEPHHSFGHDLVGQTWELSLSAGLDLVHP